MKYIFTSLCICLLISCSNRKVTKVEIKNSNQYPITFTVKALNTKVIIADVLPGDTKSAEFDWTDIEKKEGQWFLFVKNNQTGGTDSFAHGYFTHGELSNYLDAESMGSQLKVKVTE